MKSIALIVALLTAVAVAQVDNPCVTPLEKTFHVTLSAAASNATGACTAEGVANTAYIGTVEGTPAWKLTNVSRPGCLNFTYNETSTVCETVRLCADIQACPYAYVCGMPDGPFRATATQSLVTTQTPVETGTWACQSFMAIYPGDLYEIAVTFTGPTELVDNMTAIVVEGSYYNLSRTVLGQSADTSYAGGYATVHMTFPTHPRLDIGEGYTFCVRAPLLMKPGIAEVAAGYVTGRYGTYDSASDVYTLGAPSVDLAFDVVVREWSQFADCAFCSRFPDDAACDNCTLLDDVCSPVLLCHNDSALANRYVDTTLWIPAACNGTCVVDVDCVAPNACVYSTCSLTTHECVDYPIAEIDDGDACTIDLCVPENGTVIHVAIVCNDGDASTTDACVAGACVYTHIQPPSNEQDLVLISLVVVSAFAVVCVILIIGLLFALTATTPAKPFHRAAKAISQMYSRVEKQKYVGGGSGSHRHSHALGSENE